MNLLRVVALLLAGTFVLFGCGNDGDNQRQTAVTSTSDTPSTSPAGLAVTLPPPVQLAPPEGRARLTPDDVDAVLSGALHDVAVSSAIKEGTVAQVVIRASTTGEPSGGEAGDVAFLFAEPVRPAGTPWEVLCDIGGQTEQWSGVVARVVLASGAVDGSPVWLTGANCVGMVMPTGRR